MMKRVSVKRRRWSRNDEPSIEVTEVSRMDFGGCGASKSYIGLHFVLYHHDSLIMRKGGGYGES
jgi:hypothetical protein